MNTFLATLIFFWTVSAHAFDVPVFQPNVVDRTGTLTPNEIGRLNAEIESIRGQSHIYAAILMVPTLDGESVEAVAERVFREWKLGQKGTDNGLLFLVAVSDRKMKIETGYGLEGSIPDARARRIIDQILKPKFRDGKFAAGLTEALRAASSMVQSDGEGDLSKAVAIDEGEPFDLKLMGAVWIFFILVVPALVRFASVRHARGFSVKLQPTAEESSWVRQCFGKVVFLPLFLIVNPGVFFILFARQRSHWPIGLVIMGFASVFLLAFNWDYLAMWSEKLRLNSINKPKSSSGGWRRSKSTSVRTSSDSSDSTFWSSSSSSSSSSDSSSSSSSDGGSSGGGGASGEW